MKSINDLHEATLPEEAHANIALGEFMRTRREAKRISVDEMAREMKVAPRYVAAFEEGAYHIFPAKIYAHGFLKRSLPFLGITEQYQQTACMEMFQEEWLAHFPGKDKEPVTLPTSIKKHASLFTSSRLLQALGVIALAAFFIFLAIQLMHFTGAPRLALEEPADQFLVHDPFVRVRGTTERESQLTVNGREVIIDRVGNFDTQIDLQPGVNILEFLVKNRFGKETKSTRVGVVE